CSKRDGFVPELLRIIADRNVAEPVQQSAAIYFKLAISKSWEAPDDDDSDDHDADAHYISDEDKNFVKANLLNVMCEATDASRFKRSKEKETIAVPISKIEPLVFYHCNQLLNNQSAEAVVIKKQGLKTIYVLTQLDTIEDRDERAHTVWWKCKKWAIKLLDRVFDRYGSPNQVPVNYVVFAKHFLTKWSSDILEVIMRLLNAQRNNIYVSDRDLIKNVLFPLLCYNDEDEEICFLSDIFEDMHSPVCEAGTLLRGLAKRKDIVQPVLAFAIQVLTRASSAREVEGALRVLGELDAQLTKSKAVNSLVRCLCSPDEELPVKVEAALAIQSILKNQEKAHALLEPCVKDIIVHVLEIVAKTQVEDVVRVVDELLEHFLDTSNLFLQIISGPGECDQTHALMSLIPTITNILDVVEDHQEIMVQVEPSILKIIKYILVEEKIDLFHVLHLYLVTDTDSFLAFPERLKAFMDMCQMTLEASYLVHGLGRIL
ncbi:unnamed protein product, partial [Heligmosomoides polygyrus]|uniref:Importin N-terminal domain-containing protein n=1 Tax=Heligmosomoides polygyrus TaxID=6339 RepID=A0A183GHK3_HELPZ